MLQLTKMSKSRSSVRKFGKPIPWLPIDSRLIPNIFAFGHVKGIARIFLVIEIVSSVLVVIGTFCVVAIKLFGL